MFSTIMQYEFTVSEEQGSTEELSLHIPTYTADTKSGNRMLTYNNNTQQ